MVVSSRVGNRDEEREERAEERVRREEVAKEAVLYDEDIAIADLAKCGCTKFDVAVAMLRM